eukprot:TRINITY_DN33288_c0_g1_i1.p1 TRINITY_DN33288_c0_g1~~TRINITY_DN33288_c0_g1_i1.p1  ORF type:complete len:173 (+),score=17.40 TRINITY_DN33288_c0_g1_i1:192-710(+)
MSRLGLLCWLGCVAAVHGACDEFSWGSNEQYRCTSTSSRQPVMYAEWNYPTGTGDSGILTLCVATGWTQPDECRYLDQGVSLSSSSGQVGFSTFNFDQWVGNKHHYWQMSIGGNECGNSGQFNNPGGVENPNACSGLHNLTHTTVSVPMQGYRPVNDTVGTSMSSDAPLRAH